MKKNYYAMINLTTHDFMVGHQATTQRKKPRKKSRGKNEDETLEEVEETEDVEYDVMKTVIPPEGSVVVPLNSQLLSEMSIAEFEKKMEPIFENGKFVGWTERKTHLSVLIGDFDGSLRASVQVGGGNPNFKGRVQISSNLFASSEDLPDFPELSFDTSGRARFRINLVGSGKYWIKVSSDRRPSVRVEKEHFTNPFDA